MNVQIEENGSLITRETNPFQASPPEGRNDYVIGDAVGQRGLMRNAFTFVCGFDFSSGRVRSVDVTPRR